VNTNELIPLLSEMAIFAKVAECGSFSKAASTLGIAPSSVSRSVTRLEDALQQKLLERNTRQMRLSASGHQVYELCNDMLSAANLAVSAAQSDKEEISGSLCIAAPKALSKANRRPGFKKTRAMSSGALRKSCLSAKKLHPKTPG